MATLSRVDLLIILGFLVAVLVAGFLPKKIQKGNHENFLLSGRRVGLGLFVLTNVAAWYGGILGVGEFSYRYGLLSWFTQGLPYYIFALLFAIFFAGKIRRAGILTIPDRLQQAYGSRLSLFGAFLVFLLVSPAPYLLMIAGIFSFITGWGQLPSLLFCTVLSSVYLFRGGYRSSLFIDAFNFFVMFLGFIICVLFCCFRLGGFGFLKANLPAQHLNPTGGASFVYILVWFLIALWTFADPGFHQRCSAAKDERVARWGIIISIGFWAIFDFLTTSTGLYARAALPHLSNPVMSYPMLAEKILSPGVKGLFFAAMLATVLSTLNSFFFLSGETFGKDILLKLRKEEGHQRDNLYTRIGMLVSGAISIFMALRMNSVIGIWYSLGSIIIPAMLMPIIGAYYPKYRIKPNALLLEMVLALSAGSVWLMFRPSGIPVISEVEPMILGLSVAGTFHSLEMFREKRVFSLTGLQKAP